MKTVIHVVGHAAVKIFVAAVAVAYVIALGLAFFWPKPFAPGPVLAYEGQRVVHPDGSTVCIIARDLRTTDVMAADFCRDWTISDPPHSGESVREADWIHSTLNRHAQINVEGKWVP